MNKMLASALVLCVLYRAALTVPTELKNLSNNAQWFQQCPESFILLHGRCYHFGSQQSTWYEAFQRCSNLKSNLVSIESAKESFAIVSYLMSVKGGKAGWWTSGNDEEFEGKWFWIGSETPVRYSRWCPKQPDNYKSEHCLHLKYYNDEICWNDLPCLSKVESKMPLYYICETDPYNTKFLCPL